MCRYYGREILDVVLLLIYFTFWLTQLIFYGINEIINSACSQMAEEKKFNRLTNKKCKLLFTTFRKFYVTTIFKNIFFRLAVHFWMHMFENACLNLHEFLLFNAFNFHFSFGCISFLFDCRSSCVASNANGTIKWWPTNKMKWKLTFLTYYKIEIKCINR